MRIRVTREMALSREFSLQALHDADQGYTSGRTITHGSLRQGLWKVSWPILVTAACLSIVDLVHVQCAGTLNTGAQAIIGVCDQFMLMCIIVITSLSSAGTALVSMAYGSRNSKDVAAMTQQMLVLMVGLAAAMSLLMILLRKTLLSAFAGCVGNSEIAIDDGGRYLVIVAFVLIPCAVVSTINATFTGIGNARVQLMTLSLMTVIDMIINYLLVIKGWPISGTGLTGIAVASITAYSCAALLACLAWWRSDIRKKSKGGTSLTLASSKFIRTLLATGIPSATQEVAWCSSTFVLFWILSLLKQSNEAVAAWTIGQRLEAFALLPLSAMSMAVLVAVGQNLGSGRAERAWKATWTVTALAVAMLMVAGVALFFFAEPLAKGATANETTRSILVSYLRIAAFGLPFAALETVLTGSLQSMNDSRVPMIFSLVSNWAVGLSLTFILAVTLGQGPTGAWFAMVITTTILGTLIAGRFVTKPEWKGLSPLSVTSSQAEPDQQAKQTNSQPEPDSSSHDVACKDQAPARHRHARELNIPSTDAYNDYDSP